jgi:flavin-binding protein dodecin
LFVVDETKIERSVVESFQVTLKVGVAVCAADSIDTINIVRKVVR